LQAADYGNQILIAGETDDFQVVEQWEPVTEADVQTPSEVYQELAGEGCALYTEGIAQIIWCSCVGYVGCSFRAAQPLKGAEEISG